MVALCSIADVVFAFPRGILGGTRCGGAGLEEAAKTISNAPDQVAAVDYRVKSFLRVIAVANGMDRAPLT